MSFRETFLVCFLSLLCGSVACERRRISDVNAAKKGSFLHMSEEKGNAKTSRLKNRYISLAFSTCGTLYLRLYYPSVLSLRFTFQSDNVN